jgi:succinate dehydrogenase/fumarate reductase cytochrome b subunit
MKRSYLWAAWLWAIQALTGLLLVTYIIVHTYDNGMILFGRQAFEDMLKLWHVTLPHFLYLLMVIGLAGVFFVHMMNGIRIASKPYKEVDRSWKHAWMLRHSGTTFWFTQVLTGSIVAMIGFWHFIVQHAGKATMTASQSAERITLIVFLTYVLFLAAVMFHSFNGIRSVIIKLGVMTDKAKEGILVGLVALFFLIFFGVGAASVGVFLSQHAGAVQEQSATELSTPDRDNQAEAAENVGGESEETTDEDDND